MLQTLNTNLIQSQDITKNFSEYAAQAIQGITVLISRPKKKNVALISQERLTELLRAENNLRMDDKLDRARAEMEKGQGMRKSWKELGI